MLIGVLKLNKADSGVCIELLFFLNTSPKLAETWMDGNKRDPNVPQHCVGDWGQLASCASSANWKKI